MAHGKIRFNKTKLQNLVHEQKPCIVKDTVIAGLKFRVGRKRSVFFFEKRISGRKGAPITITIEAFPVVSLEYARQEAYRLANLCERGRDPWEENHTKEISQVLFRDAIDQFFELAYFVQSGHPIR